MRCEDLTRELATPAPGGGPGAGEVADHLASCPRCAGWSRRSGRLDRIWEATRPAEPPPAALDALWARAAAALDAPAPAAIPFRPRRRTAIAALALAQAAAVAVAATLLLRGGGDPPRVAVVPPPAPALVTVGDFQTVVVRIGDEGHRVEVLDDSAQFARPSMADATPHDVFNAVESMVTQ